MPAYWLGLDQRRPAGSHATSAGGAVWVVAIAPGWLPCWPRARL